MKKYFERHDPAWLGVSQKLRQVHAQLSKLKEEYAVLKEQLIDLSQEKSSMGGGVRLSHSMRKGVIDYSKIPELEAVDLERYRKPATETWTLTITDRDDSVENFTDYVRYGAAKGDPELDLTIDGQ